MEFAVIVPARRASTRLPEKMLADIGGEPMIVRTLRRAAQSRAARVFAASDDDAIAEACRAAGFECAQTGEHDCGTSRAAAAAEKAGEEAVVTVQGDEPFIEPQIINGVASLLGECEDCVCATAARKIQNAEEFAQSSVVKVVADSRGRALYFSRAPVPFAREKKNGSPPPSARAHIGIYAFRSDFLRKFPGLSPSPDEQCESLEQLRILWHGEKIALLDSESESFGVDTAEDLQRARERWMQ